MSGDITAADVREALLRMANDAELCDSVADNLFSYHALGRLIISGANIHVYERAALAAEAGAEGER